MSSTSEISRAESPPTSPDIKRLASPLLFGPLFNWALYGVLCVQIYVYSYNFPKDRRPVKYLAYFIFLLESAQTALTGADAYFWFVDGFGNVEHLGDSHFGPIDNPIMIAIISLVVQGYFCHRIWVLSRRSSWICWVIAVSTVTQSVGAVWSGIKAVMVGKYAVTKAGVYLWSIPSALADILIAVAMTLLLRRTSGKLCNFVLVRVIRLTIETNALTASTLVTTLVLYVAFPNDIYYVYPSGIIGKLYSNTFLVSLNNRIYFRDCRSSERGDNASILDSDQLRATAATSLHFAGTGPRSRVPTDDSFQLSTSTQTVELNRRKGDDTSINWSLSHLRKGDLLSGDPECTVDTLSPVHGQRDEEYGRSG
ncbi:hypothetical protein EDB85DRAFT_1957525 [Lactarius pseudohatsudake]|nr:hypothetical protein EDB85DRAFT_1957525 [Lactarius pseudohatsudake]